VARRNAETSPDREIEKPARLDRAIIRTAPCPSDGSDNRIIPYLSRVMTMDWPRQVWAADIANIAVGSRLPDGGYAVSANNYDTTCTCGAPQSPSGPLGEDAASANPMLRVPSMQG
jgi:hypothetical protein